MVFQFLTTVFQVPCGPLGVLWIQARHALFMQIVRPLSLSRILARVKKPKPRKEKQQPNAEAAARLTASKLAAMPTEWSVGTRKRSRELEELFLTGLRNAWSVSKSAKAIGVDVQTPYNWKNASLASRRDDGTYVDDFCVRWVEAYETGVDRIEDEVIRRAVEGVEKPVYQGGILVGSVTEYSDTLAGLVMRGKRPGVYNTERHEHTGKDGGAIEHNMQIEFVKAKGEK